VDEIDSMGKDGYLKIRRLGVVDGVERASQIGEKKKGLAF